MRMLPIALYTRNMNPINIIQAAHDASRLTHGHPVSLVGCGIYCLVVSNLLKGMDKKTAINTAYSTASALYSRVAEYSGAFKKYNDIQHLDTVSVKSSGYVVDTLVAALYCLYHYNTYSSVVLHAVNLGEDTDTVGAVAGSLAGLIYKVPIGWIKQLQSLSYLNHYIEEFMLVL